MLGISDIEEDQKDNIENMIKDDDNQGLIAEIREKGDLEGTYSKLKINNSNDVTKKD